VELFRHDEAGLEPEPFERRPHASLRLENRRLVRFSNRQREEGADRVAHCPP
jgi:hypothetical protein